MTVYVAINRINGRYDLMELATKLLERGFDDRVEYNDGGWMDKEVHTALPHLKFEDEDDAIAFALAYGSFVSRKVPTKENSG